VKFWYSLVDINLCVLFYLNMEKYITFFKMTTKIEWGGWGKGVVNFWCNSRHLYFLNGVFFVLLSNFRPCHLCCWPLEVGVANTKNGVAKKIMSALRTKYKHWPPHYEICGAALGLGYRSVKLLKGSVQKHDNLSCIVYAWIKLNDLRKTCCTTYVKMAAIGAKMCEFLGAKNNQLNFFCTLDMQV